jgi:hypothetical protein
MCQMVRAAGLGAAMGVLMAAILCAGCSGTTGGNGSTGGSPGSSSAPGFPTETPSGGQSRGTSPATDSSTPNAIPAPEACPGGTCKQTMSTTLTAPFEVIVRANPAYANGTGAAIVELTQSGVPISWYVVPGETPAEITCSSTPNQSNCVLVNHVGEHASDGIVFRLSGNTLHRGSTVRATTRQMHARDLNGDGWVDVAGLQNTGKPDYATGQVYWQTWVSNGVFLNSTGCTGLASAADPQPAELVHGNCP